MEDKLTFHLFISEKLNVLAPNKTGTRYVGRIFELNNGSEYTIQTTTDFKLIKEKIYDSNDRNIETDVKLVETEFNSIMDGSSKKNVLILYRNPYNRLITGLVQNFYSDLYTGNFGFDFKLKLLLDNYKYGPNIYRKINLYNENIYEVLDILTNDEIETIKKIFLEYSYESPIEHLLNESHLAPYLSYLYSIFSTRTFPNTFILFDIDNKNISLKEYLKKFFKYDIEWDNGIKSNSVLVNDIKTTSFVDDKIYNMLEFFKLEKIKLKLFDITKVERFFYNKFKQLPNNINFISE